MGQNKISPREAAIAVLNKAKEMYQLSNLAKAESKHDRCVKDVERNSPDIKNAHAVCVAEGVKPAKWSKSEDASNPDAAADAALGEKVEQDVQQHEEQNADPKHAMKGHIKLAKFMGRMEHKKGEKAKSMAKTDGMGQSLGGAINFPGAPATAPSPAPSPVAKAESAFDKVKNSIKEKEGYSEKAAAATAAKIGREKLGEAEMARRSAAARKK